MEVLSGQYTERLDAIADAIQNSELLAAYLETEEEELYKQMQDAIEPHIHELYQYVADHHPMQLIALEDELTDDRYEGMYLPKLLGYSVLRGVLNSQYKYLMPQEQFKKILLAICDSPNFDLIHKRIGQTVQTGFALSSDIWITNLVNTIDNKRIRTFLNAQKLNKYRDVEGRAYGYHKYAKQFGAYNFYTAHFPRSLSEMHTYYPELKQFLIKRVILKRDDSSLQPYILDLMNNEKLRGDEEFIFVLGLVANYFDTGEEGNKSIANTLNQMRKESPGFVETYFEFLKELLQSEIPVTAECDHRMSAMIDTSIKDDFTKYYKLTDIIHTKGYIHEDTIEAIQNFYYQHEGLSTINECLRQTILTYFAQILNHLDETDYTEYFELNKTFTQYINIFSNQQFNQSVKTLCLRYIRKLLKHYTDKRGKDYQDIKKFVMTTFEDLGFMKPKELTELFKTKRKKKKPAAAN